MVVNIVLDKVSYYKEDWESDNLIKLTGNITGLDSSKEYCIMWCCDLCVCDIYSGKLVHGPTLEYYYIKGVSSIPIYSGSHIHKTDLFFDSYGKAHSNIWVNEISGRCENVIKHLVAIKEFNVYSYYSAVQEGKADIVNIVFKNSLGQTITKASKGELVYATYDLKNIGNVTDDFFTIATIDGTKVKDTFTTIIQNGYKTIVTSSWIMSGSAMTLSIEAGHWEGFWKRDVLKTAIIELKPPEFCDQKFRSEDQYGNPIGCVISSPVWDADLTVPKTGTASLYMTKGIIYTVTAYNYELNQQQTKTFTSCTIDPVKFIFTVEAPPIFGRIDKVTHEFLPNYNARINVTFTRTGTETAFRISLYYGDKRLYPTGLFQQLIFMALNETKTIAIDSEVGHFSFVDIENSTIKIKLEDHDFNVIDTYVYFMPKYVQPPDPKGEIGIVTYNIIKQLGKDEIEFYIPITNTSSKTRCYYVDLYNQIKFLEREPFGLNYITLKPGKSTTLKMTSVGAVFPMWSIEDVQDQVIKFQLRSVEAGLLDVCPLTGYEIVYEAELDMVNINSIITAYVDNTEGLVTKNLKIGLLYVDPLGVFKKDVCGSPIDVENVTSTVISTQWNNPGPFTCDSIAYSVGSKFILYAEGYDINDNKYIVKSDMFESIYGKREVTIKITGLPEEKCVFKNPLDPTACLLTEDQKNLIKWGFIGIATLYVLSITAPLIRGVGYGVERIAKRK